MAAHRKPLNAEQEAEVRRLHDAGEGEEAIAAALSIGRRQVQRAIWGDEEFNRRLWRQKVREKKRKAGTLARTLPAIDKTMEECCN